MLSCRPVTLSGLSVYSVARTNRTTASEEDRRGVCWRGRTGGRRPARHELLGQRRGRVRGVWAADDGRLWRQRHTDGRSPPPSPGSELIDIGVNCPNYCAVLQRNSRVDESLFADHFSSLDRPDFNPCVFVDGW